MSTFNKGDSTYKDGDHLHRAHELIRADDLSGIKEQLEKHDRIIRHMEKPGVLGRSRTGNVSTKHEDMKRAHKVLGEALNNQVSFSPSVISAAS
jgi:hypothetical protein